VLNVFPDEQEKLDLPAYFSVGLHPWYVHESTWEEQLEKVRASVSDKMVIAVGETGLDKKVAIDYALQWKAFSAQLDISAGLKKPLIVHCVRSYSEMLAIRKKSDLSIPWIFHWFNADEQIARELIRKNCYLSFGHMLFNEQSKAYRIFQHMPPGHVFFETDDAGYTIREIYERAANIRKMQSGELKNTILDNFNRCFQV